MSNLFARLSAVSSEQIDAPLLPPEPMAEPKSVRLGFVTGLVAVDKLQACYFLTLVHIGRFGL